MNKTLYYTALSVILLSSGAMASKYEEGPSGPSRKPVVSGEAGKAITQTRKLDVTPYDGEPAEGDRADPRGLTALISYGNITVSLRDLLLNVAEKKLTEDDAKFYKEALKTFSESRSGDKFNISNKDYDLLLKMNSLIKGYEFRGVRDPQTRADLIEARNDGLRIFTAELVAARNNSRNVGLRPSE